MSTWGRKEHCGINFHDPLLQPKPDGVDLRSLWTLLYPSTSGDWYGCSADLWKHPHRPAEQYMLLLKLLPQPHGSTAYLWLMTVRRTRSKFREAAPFQSEQKWRILLHFNKEYYITRKSRTQEKKSHIPIFISKNIEFITAKHKPPACFFLASPRRPPPCRESLKGKLSGSVDCGGERRGNLSKCICTFLLYVI